jgi:O-antigen/teichoic acid export membrane protein
MKIKLIELVKHSKSKYIATTLVISAIGMLKNFILLKIFDFDKLGIVTLSLTFTVTISLLQVGIVTGGYRLFAYRGDRILKKVNSAVFVFFCLLTILLVTVGIIIDCFFKIKISSLLLFFLIGMGITSLYSDWVVCKLLGTKNILVVNKAQLLGTIIAFIVTLTVKWFGMPAVLGGLILQPILTIIIAYIYLPILRPVFNFIDFKNYIKKIISLGFIPYLTTAITYFNSQLGRWLITFSLGTAILGRTFLVTLFIALITIIPSAISNLFFPNIIERFEKGKWNELNVTLKRQIGILIIYYSFIILATLLLANIVVKLFLPKQIESVYLIYGIIPSLFFLHLSGPAITLFNAAKKFKLILIGSLTSVFTYIILLTLYLLFLKPQILGFYIIESISSFMFFIFNYYNYIKLSKSINYDK